MVNVIAMIFHCYCLETPARYILLLLWLQPFIPSGPAHLIRITAIVWLCYSIRQLQSSDYTCQWENWIIGRSMSYPFQLVVIKPPPADLFRSLATTNSASAFEKDGIRRARSYIFAHFIYGVHDNYTNADAQWRSCLRWFWRKDSTAACLCKIQIQSDGAYTCRSNAKINWIIWVF